MFEFILLALAIENLSDILVNVDIAWMEKTRAWFEKVPYIGKLARCRYCQMLWLAVLFCLVVPPVWMVMALALHRVGQLISEFYERYLNRAPLNIYVQQPKN